MIDMVELDERATSSVNTTVTEDETFLERVRGRIPTVRPEQVSFPFMRWLLRHPRLTDRAFARIRWGNQFSAERLADPYVAADKFLDDGYVTFHKIYGQWIIMGYEEARHVLQSPSFGVGDRVDLLASIRPYTKLDPKTLDVMRLWPAFVDPPDHGRLRKLVVRWFTPNRIAELKPMVEGLVAGLIDEMSDDIAAGRPIDIMSRFASPLPVNVIGHIMGMPPESWAELKRLSDELTPVLDPGSGIRPPGHRPAVQQIS